MNVDGDVSAGRASFVDGKAFIRAGVGFRDGVDAQGSVGENAMLWRTVFDSDVILVPADRRRRVAGRVAR